MNWITVTWPMVAAACLTLGLIELGIGLAQPPRAARLLFALSAFTVACIAGLELTLMQTDVLADWWRAMRLLDIAVGVMLLSLTAFIWVYFGDRAQVARAGGPGPLCHRFGIRLSPRGASRLGNDLPAVHRFQNGRDLRWGQLPGSRRGAKPLECVPYLAVLALILFVVDASLRLRRRGGRGRTVLVGVSVAVFLAVAGLQSALIEIGIVNTPYMISWAYLAVLMAMASELNADVLAAAQLAGQLRESERRMDLASAAANLGLVGLGHPPRQHLGHPPRPRAVWPLGLGAHHLPAILNTLHPEDRAPVERAVAQALAADRGLETEYRVSLPDGQTRWIAARGQVERDPNGKPVLMRGVVLDISARRDAEVERQQLRTELAHASRVSMLGQLAAALAHELSQPLGAILRNTEAAEIFIEHDSPDLDELRAILADIRHDDQRATGVIERLRALLERRSFAPRALAVSGEVLEPVIALAQFDAWARQVRLEIEAAPALPAVLGDPVQLQQVLLNLVLNAMDAVADRPADRRQVTVRARRRGERAVEVAVADSGSGIAPERLGRLFEPFFTTKPTGMGIGLSLSRTLIEAHGGRLWAENNAGEGATFRFTLPLAGDAAPP